MQPELTPLPMSFVYPRVYRPRAVARALGYAMAAAFAGGGVALALRLTSVAQPKLTIYGVLATSLVAAGAALALYTMRYRVILDADAVTVTQLWGQRRLALADIAGRRARVDPQSGLVTTRIVPTPAAPKHIDVMERVMIVDDAYRDWIARLPDLDARDRQLAEAELMAGLGGGALASAKLERARTAATVLNAVGIVLALWGFSMPQPYRMVTLLLAVAPWLALVVVALSKGVIRLDRERNSPNPHVALLFLMPAMALGLRAVFDVSLAAPVQLLLPAAVLAAPMIGLLLRFEPSTRQAPGVLLLVIAFAHAAATVTLADVELDQAPAEVHHAHVTGKRTIEGRHTEYELTIDWLPGANRETSVSLAVYQAVAIGSPVAVGVRPGALHLEWYGVRPE